MMSGWLLDTHIWLWYTEGAEDQLKPATIERLDDMRYGEGLWVSAVSVWEVCVLAAKGRVQLSVPLRDWVDRALEVPGVYLAPLDALCAVESTLLPGQLRGDPADRFLVATARTQGKILATRDRPLLDYAKRGLVNAVAL
jgi:PIN domain nuclease of toxin-antitoxin system